MSFRILHYSDSHLCFEQYGNTTRLIDFAASLKEVLRVAIDMKVDAVVDTGDTFNSPHPDPFSIQALRHFIAELDKRMIRFIGIIGNHNRHEIQDRVPGADWFTAVSDAVIRPSSPGQVINVDSWFGNGSINIVAADWMPSSDIPDFLSKVPKGIDALFMHQSCEHFLPSVSKPEMVVSQVDGVARYVGVGDVHVTKTLTTPQGTIIGSAGSTEMSKRNEDPVKYVMLVTFDGDKAPVCERIEIQTRGIITFPTITLPEHIGVFLDHVRKRIVTGERLPMVVASYDRSLHVEVQAAVKIIEGMGIDIVRMTSESAVVDEADLSGHVEAGSVLMADILREMFPEGSVERDLSLSLWDSPMTAEQTLESFVDQTKKKHATQESNTQQHLPAPPP